MVKKKSLKRKWCPWVLPLVKSEATGAFQHRINKNWLTFWKDCSDPVERERRRRDCSGRELAASLGDGWAQGGSSADGGRWSGPGHALSSRTCYRLVGEEEGDWGHLQVFGLRTWKDTFSICWDEEVHRRILGAGPEVQLERFKCELHLWHLIADAEAESGS